MNRSDGFEVLDEYLDNGYVMVYVWLQPKAIRDYLIPLARKE